MNRYQINNVIQPLPIPKNDKRNKTDLEHMRVMELHVETANLAITELHDLITFLLPHATKQILHDQLCRENENLRTIHDQFLVSARLIEPRLDNAIKDLVDRGHVDLLQNLDKNK